MEVRCHHRLRQGRLRTAEGAWRRAKKCDADAASGRDPGWDSLPTEVQQNNARQMEVFAGFAAHTDAELGRVVDAVRSLADRETTSIIYIPGDTGASARAGPAAHSTSLHRQTAWRRRWPPRTSQTLAAPPTTTITRLAGQCLEVDVRSVCSFKACGGEREFFSPPPSCAASGKGKSRRIHAEYPH